MALGGQVLPRDDAPLPLGTDRPVPSVPQALSGEA